MTGYTSDPFSAASVVEPSVRRLGERTCVITLGTELRHFELPFVDEALRSVMHDDCHDLVFDLTYLRRFETFALVRMTREWDRLAAGGCAVHVAARDAHVIADIERLVGDGGWQLHPTVTHALRALLSAPVD
jgi:hypothetical protein